MRPPKRVTSTQKKKTTSKKSSAASQVRSQLKELHPDLKNWFSKDFIVETFSGHPVRQLIVVGVAILLCLYIALIAAAGQKEKPDDTILTTNIALEDVFTQKSMRNVRTRMEIAEDSTIYIYESPSVTVDHAGTITSFALPLATIEKNDYDLWPLSYNPETKNLHLAQTEDNLSVKKLEFDLTELPTDDIIKTFTKFPAKYVTQIYPIPEGSTYTFAAASTPAVLNYEFSEEVSEGVPGLWISRSGGGSVIDGSFVPTGEYLTYRCSCTDELGIDLEFLVMTEIQNSLS